MHPKINPSCGGIFMSWAELAHIGEMHLTGLLGKIVLLKAR